MASPFLLLSHLYGDEVMAALFGEEQTISG